MYSLDKVHHIYIYVCHIVVCLCTYVVYFLDELRGVTPRVEFIKHPPFQEPSKIGSKDFFFYTTGSDISHLYKGGSVVRWEQTVTSVWLWERGR